MFVDGECDRYFYGFRSCRTQDNAFARWVLLGHGTRCALEHKVNPNSAGCPL